LVDVPRARFDLLALGLQQLKDADQHRVVLELGFFDDLLLQRQCHVA
jgi:hypothetical protein